MNLNSADAAGLLADIAADQFNQMENERKEFSERMANQQKTVDASANRIMERLAMRRNPDANRPKYTLEVTKIADLLTAYPKLVPVVNSVIQQLLVTMEHAFDQAASQYYQQPPQAGSDTGGTPNA